MAGPGRGDGKRTPGTPSAFARSSFVIRHSALSCRSLYPAGDLCSSEGIGTTRGGAMTVWAWVDEFEARARACGDAGRLRLASIHPEAYSFRQSDPDRMLGLLEQGRRLARALDEPWWVLFFEHWKLETLIYYKDDYRQVLDQAVRLVLGLRRPALAHHPLRFGVYCNLIAAYLCVDPRGYAGAIAEALEHLRTQMPPEGGDRYLLLARRHWFAYEVGDLEGARGLALEELALADLDPDRHLAGHHEVDTCKALRRIAFRQGDAEALAGWSS